MTDHISCLSPLLAVRTRATLAWVCAPCNECSPVRTSSSRNISTIGNCPTNASGCRHRPVGYRIETSPQPVSRLGRNHLASFPGNARNHPWTKYGPGACVPRLRPSSDDHGRQLSAPPSTNSVLYPPHSPTRELWPPTGHCSSFSGPRRHASHFDEGGSYPSESSTLSCSAASMPRFSTIAIPLAFLQTWRPGRWRSPRASHTILPMVLSSFRIFLANVRCAIPGPVAFSGILELGFNTS